MGSQLNVYNLGKRGVNVDKSPIHLDDNELTKSQNAIHDPLGVDGGLKNRPGLIKVNSGAAAGSITGGIGVPFTRPATRTLYMGHDRTQGTTTAGWRTSTNEFASGSVTVDIPQAPRGDDAMATIAADYGVTPNPLLGVGGVVSGNRLYYANNYGTSGLEAIAIRVFDGTVDKTLAVLPNDPITGGFAKCTLSFLAANGTIYMSTFDSGTTSANARGRVFELNPASGALTLIGTTFAAGLLPYALAWYQGRLWVGLHPTNVTVGGQVHFIRPGLDLAWTSDEVFASPVCSLGVYKGLLYAGLSAPSGTAAIISVRSTVAVWSTSQTGPNTGKANGYYSMSVLGANLYASFYDPINLVGNIEKFDGSVWSTVFTGTAAERTSYFLQTYNSRIFAFGLSDTNAPPVFTSANGTSWTDRSGQFNAQLMPVFGALVS